MVIPADRISREEFGELLARYPAVLDSISSSKGGTSALFCAPTVKAARRANDAVGLLAGIMANPSTLAVKDGQKPLSELDAYRYEEAPTLFASDESKRQMDLDAIKILVEWKLRHGKFRPTLMSLVSSNNPNLVADTVREALGVYRDGGNVAAALQVLTRLKGIGPATASLLLAVHDPTRVIFFSDEAFYWLCRSGRKAPIKYNAKEYQELRTKAQELAERLDVSATDLEKVAYVLMKQPDNMAEASMNASAKTTPTPAKGASATKRKAARELESAPKEPPVRRSKRSKAC